MKKLFLICIVLGSLSFSIGAAEYTDGRIRLVINENTGRFSLYFMTDIARERYFPFFVDQDPRTSFLALMVNNRNYRMGESASFKTKLGGTPSNPALIFESSFLTVTEEFSFIRTGSSSLTNGIRLTITIHNRGEQPIEAGVRFLIDTILGEEDSSHFSTDRRQIRSEAVIDASSGDAYWISRGSLLALMGSVEAQGTRPDSIHLANWKRLNDTPWKIPLVSGRNFNFLPYSINDSAVCYYYEPAVINPGGFRAISVVLAAEDENGFALNNAVPDDLSRLIRDSTGLEGTDLRGAMQTDLITLRDLVARLDNYLSSGTSVAEEELAAMGLLISKIKAKYGIQ
ncbi:MAG: hypothetical protein LBO65_03075 [Spirochaetaceae bacterium]|jgi:hypothetical protein|nr:hypothetical protein [Spirochaetaceae bacterium]